MPAFMAALLQAISPKKVQQAQKNLRMCPADTHRTHSTCQPFLTLTPHLPHAHVCVGDFWLLYFICPLTFFNLQSSIQLLDHPASSIHCTASP